MKLVVAGELFSKLEARRVKIEHVDSREWREFLRCNDEFIEILSDSKYCRKCRKLGPIGNVPVIHHPNIVWTTTGGMEKSNEHRRKRPCKYVEFQVWMDFLVANKQVILDHETFAEQLKETLEVIHATELLLPPFEWHYRQFFKCQLPDLPADHTGDEAKETEDEESPTAEKAGEEEIEITKRKETDVNNFEDVNRQDSCQAPSISDISVEQQAKRLDREEVQPTIGSEEHRATFLDFFISFFLAEYEIDDSIESISWYSDLIMDLYMEPLGLLNLGYEIYLKYPEHVQERFGHSFVPFDIMVKKMTVDDLYEEIFM